MLKHVKIVCQKVVKVSCNITTPQINILRQIFGFSAKTFYLSFLVLIKEKFPLIRFYFEANK